MCFSAEGTVEFEVLKILQFDTIRKRMSVILKHPISGEITLYTKGADSSILTILNKNYKGKLWYCFYLAQICCSFVYINNSIILFNDTTILMTCMINLEP